MPTTSPAALRRSPISRTWQLIRFLVRVSFALSATGVLAVIWFLARPFTAWRPDRRRALRGFVFSRWARACLTAFGVRLRVSGALPQAPCFLVANHLSYVDILVIASRLNCVFVSMTEVLDWPFIGSMADSFGTVFLDRQKKRDILRANRAMQSFLHQGFIVVLFPEGKSSRGERVDPFRPSLLEPAAHTQQPVTCATLRYTTGPHDAPASTTVCWTDPNFLRHVLRLFTLDRIDAELTFHPDIHHDSDRKNLAKATHAEVQAHFTPLT